MTRWLGFVLLLCAACEPASEPPPKSAPPPPPPSASVEELGTGTQVYQGRIALGSPAESWIDIEVIGPARDSRWACEALLESERGRIASAGLSIAVTRPCSDAALEPAPATRPWAIATSDRFDDAGLMLELGARAEGHQLAPLRARRAQLSMFTDESSCRGALEKLETARAESAAQARQKALSFLEQSLQSQKEAARKSCAGTAKSEGCGNARELERVLERKLNELRAAPETDLAGPQKCFRRD